MLEKRIALNLSPNGDQYIGSEDMSELSTHSSRHWAWWCRTLLTVARICFVLVMAMMFLCVADAAEVGIKYNRAKSAYPARVLQDFHRFHRDQINTVMIALPWKVWQPKLNHIDERFIQRQLAPVLSYAAEHGMTIIISNHSVYWGAKGNWSIPLWVRRRPGYVNATSTVTEESFRSLQITFLKQLISHTDKYPAVVGYNLLNEPVAATRYAVRKKGGLFQARWHGIIAICDAIRHYVHVRGAKQFITIGNANGDPGYAHYEWVHTGKYDLKPFWTQTLSMLSAQSVAQLREASKWYPDLPMIRTEGFMSAAQLPAKGPFRESTRAPSPPVKRKVLGNAELFFDYDSDYNYAGEANGTVPNLKAFYVWRVGSPDGKNHIGLLNFSHKVPTPYYFALRDIAAGVDSIQAYVRSSLPRNVRETRTFSVRLAKPAVSSRWTGDGAIVAERGDVARNVESSMAAHVRLRSGQSLTRSVISADWVDNGVTPAYNLVFLAKTTSPQPQRVMVGLEFGNDRAVSVPVSIAGVGWHWYSIPLAKFGVEKRGLNAVTSFMLSNRGKKDDQFLIDNILLRSNGWITETRKSSGY